jgi:competence ComEA-like helix-hairpin-helix protein
MKRSMLPLLLIFSFACVLSQGDKSLPGIHPDFRKLVLMQPTGESENNQPEMLQLEETAELYETVISNIDSCYISDFLELYRIAQSYLVNINELDSIEPAYLALTENEGGFAKQGFYLVNGKSRINKKHTPYVDITTRAAMSPLNKLMSFSQLYPHEMGHVLFRLLCREDSTENNSRSVDMHFFSLVTDYPTAFNEGFAEHIENISRLFEKNEEIKTGIQNDLEKIAASSQQAIKGFERDLIYPLRMGYYKASMLNWYQKYEDYKRHEQALNASVRYKNSSLQLSNIEDQLSYRNSGVGVRESEIRNLVQLHATEGVISSFFTNLSTSKVANNYLDISFYEDFLLDSIDHLNPPEELFTPLQNQFIKYFYVLHNYVVINNSSRSQLCDFMDGYLLSFPDDTAEVKDIFRRTTGQHYTNELPPPIWLLVKNYNHRLLTFDPYGAITVPVYTFSLNAAEVEDLQTISGLSRLDAEIIISYREENGFFTDLSQLESVPGLQKSTVKLITSCGFTTTDFENSLKDFNPELSLNSLLIAPLKSILIKSLMFFIGIFALVYFVLIRKSNPGIREISILLFRYLLLWIFLVFVGLSVVIIAENAIKYGLILALVLIVAPFVIYRKSKEKRLRTLMGIGLMTFVLLLSLI